MKCVNGSIIILKSLLNYTVWAITLLEPILSTVIALMWYFFPTRYKEQAQLFLMCPNTVDRC